MPWRHPRTDETRSGDSADRQRIDRWYAGDAERLGFFEGSTVVEAGVEVNRMLHACSNVGSDVKLHYFRMLKNEGSSGGFYEGVKRGYEIGYDRLWIMDDDCLPETVCLQALLENLSENEVGGPLKFITGTARPVYIQSRASDLLSPKCEVSSEAFNGLLVSKRTVERIGYPNKRFFIMRDDTEYCFRARVHGIKCYRVNSAHSYHPEDPHLERKILGLKIVIPFYAKGDRIYYRVRNLTYLHRLYKSEYRFRTLLKAYCYEVVGILLKEFSFERVRLFLRGIFDGFATWPEMDAPERQQNVNGEQHEEEVSK